MSRRHGASKRRLRPTARPTARCKQAQLKVKSAGAGARAGGGAENAHDGGRAGCGAYYGQGGALVPQPRAAQRCQGHGRGPSKTLSTSINLATRGQLQNNFLLPTSPPCRQVERYEIRRLQVRKVERYDMNVREGCTLNHHKFQSREIRMKLREFIYQQSGILVCPDKMQFQIFVIKEFIQQQSDIIFCAEIL